MKLERRVWSSFCGFVNLSRYSCLDIKFLNLRDRFVLKMFLEIYWRYYVIFSFLYSMLGGVDSFIVLLSESWRELGRRPANPLVRLRGKWGRHRWYQSLGLKVVGDSVRS